LKSFSVSVSLECFLLLHYWSNPHRNTRKLTLW